jgi:hypothetical protein
MSLHPYIGFVDRSECNIRGAVGKTKRRMNIMNMKHVAVE